MPTVLRKHGYVFYFYSHEPNEPPHVHVDKGGASAKFWLNSAALARNIGFSAVELRRIQRIVEEQRGLLQERWNEHFSQ
ncbi:MAG TPA: DUF4160 domain-containing protein [Planctomycetota bacterium]|jgi:hypothetical protein